MAVVIAGAGALNKDSYDVFQAALQRKAAELGVEVNVKMATPYPGEAGPTDVRPLRGAAQKDDAKRTALVAAVASDLRSQGEADLRVLPCASMLAFEQGICSQAGLSGKHISLKDAIEGAFILDKPSHKIGVICMPPARASKVFENILTDRVVYPSGPLVEELDKAGDVLQKAEIFGKDATDQPFAIPADRDAAIAAGRKTVIEITGRILADMKEKGIDRVLLARADSPQAASVLQREGKIPAGMEVKGYLDAFGEHVAQKALEFDRTRGASGGAARAATA
jgi:hypothetical protein